MSKGVKKWLLHGLSLAVAGGLLAWLILTQDWHKMFGNGRSIRWHGLVLAGAAAFAYWAVKSERWRWIVQEEGQTISPGRAWLSMLAGLGVGLATPFRGGEVVRPMFLPPGARVRLAGWVLIERLFDLSGVLILSLAGLVYVVGTDMKLAGQGVPWTLLLAVSPILLVVALGIPLLVLFRPRFLWRIWLWILPKKARELAFVRLNWRQFGIFLITSIVGESLSVVAVYFCLSTFGTVPFFASVALIPVVMLHNLLPVTPGGFGVREAFALIVFTAFGFSKEVVVAGYLTDALIVLVIPGAIGVAGAWLAGVMLRTESEA